MALALLKGEKKSWEQRRQEFDARPFGEPFIDKVVKAFAVLFAMWAIGSYVADKAETAVDDAPVIDQSELVEMGP